jgi:hypothetical protein
VRAVRRNAPVVITTVSRSIDLSHKENETIRLVVVVVSTTIKNHGFDSINPKPKQRRALTFGNELYVSDGR